MRCREARDSSEAYEIEVQFGRVIDAIKTAGCPALTTSAMHDRRGTSIARTAVRPSVHVCWSYSRIHRHLYGRRTALECGRSCFETAAPD